MAKVIGVVERLWRYPIKSMGGERLESVEINERGLVGDRLYAVRDGDGKLGSGKTTRRFRRMDGLLALSARLGDQTEMPVLLDPSGGPVADPTAFLRAYLGIEDVELAREDAVSHFDELPVSVLTTATLEWVRNAVPSAVVDERRFRPNVLVRTPPGTPPFSEDTWPGCEARTGGDLLLSFAWSSERCVMTTADQPGLPFAPEILKAIVQGHANQLGALAQVTRPGSLAVGDTLALANGTA